LVGYARVFIPLSVVIVTLPPLQDGDGNYRVDSMATLSRCKLVESELKMLTITEIDLFAVLPSIRPTWTILGRHTADCGCRKKTSRRTHGNKTSHGASPLADTT